MKTEIITIGDEILIGQIVDTNSAWIGTELNKQGYYVHQITSISDNYEHLREALTDASKRAELVIMTGGLGPTKDDLTKNILCDFFDTHLVENKEVLNDIKNFIQRRGRTEINEANRKQAEVPEKCKVLRNLSGTAPGLWFERNNVIFVSLPGVPHEMKELITKSVFPLLKSRIETAQKHIIHQTINTTGIPEATLGMRLEQWQQELSPLVKVAYLPSPGINKIRLSLEGNDKEKLYAAKQNALDGLQKELGDAIFSIDGDKLEEVVGKLLTENNATLSTAESCTGGNIAHLITSIAGSSNYFEGSVVSYSNRIKNKILNVNNTDIDLYGAVSEEVVKQMADGVKKLCATTFSVATSGVAGPGGGSDDKPVGTIWIAVASPQRTITKQFKFGNNRERNIIHATIAALNMLRLEIIASTR